jgi:hypothetical protein
MMMTAESSEKTAKTADRVIGVRPVKAANPVTGQRFQRKFETWQREHGPEAIQRLVILMRSRNESVSVRAAEALLDRGYGRPMPGIEVMDKEETPTVKQMRVVFVTPGERNSPGHDERYLPHERPVQTQTGLPPAPLMHELSSNKSRPLLGGLP